MRGKHTVLWIVVGVLLGTASASLAEDRKEHETLATILARQIQTVLNANSVLGLGDNPAVSLGFTGAPYCKPHSETAQRATSRRFATFQVTHTKSLAMTE